MDKAKVAARLMTIAECVERAASLVFVGRLAADKLQSEREADAVAELLDEVSDRLKRSVTDIAEQAVEVAA